MNSNNIEDIIENATKRKKSILFFNKSLNCIQENNYLDAIKYLKKSLSIEDNVIFRRQLFEILLFNEDYSSCLFELDKLISNHKSDELYSKRSFVNSKLNNFDLAISDINSAISINPHPFYYQQKGSIYLVLNDYFESANSINAAIKLNPSNNILKYFSFLCSNPNNLNNLKKDNILNLGIVFSEDNIKNNLENFNDLIFKKEYDSAIKLIKGFISNNPYLVTYYTTLAGLYVDLNDYDNALFELNKSIEKNPKHPISYYNRGVVKLNLQDYTGALLDLDRSISIDPYDIDPYLVKSKYYFNNDLFGEAINELDNIIKIKPIISTPYILKSIINRHFKKYSNSLDEMQFASICFDYDSDVFEEFGRLSLDMNEITTAIDNFSKGILLNPNNINCYILRSECYNKLKNYDLALFDVDNFIKLTYPDVSPEIYHLKSQLYRFMGEIEKSRDFYTLYSELKNESP